MMKWQFWMLPLVLALVGCGGSNSKTSNDTGSQMAEPDAGSAADSGDTPDADEPDASSSGDASNTDSGIVYPEAKCIESPAGLQNGVFAFEDISTEAGLTEIDAEGVRISVADLDGDGFADLAIRRVGDAPNSFAEDGRRMVWILRNAQDGSFEDVTRDSGLIQSRYAIDDVVARPSEVVVWGDVDNDGDVDALSAFTNDGTVADGPEIMENQGDGTFKPYGPLLDFHRKQEAYRIGGASFVDFNRDGRLDLWIAHGFIEGGSAQDRLYLQAPDGTFVDATDDEGLTTSDWVSVDTINTAQAHTNAWSSLAADLNGDGIPELMSASYGRAPNHLWRSSGQGHANFSLESGYAFDDNQDWTSNHSAQCYCQNNPQAEGCAECPDPVLSCSFNRGWNHSRDTQPYRLGGNSGTTVIGDVDNDGDLDLLTSEIVHFDVGANSDPSELLFNDGTATFTRPGRTVLDLTRPHPQTSWDDGDITAALLDIDNDGRLDVLINSTDYPGTRVWIWRQEEDGTFRRLTTQEGIDHTSSHGIGIADFDRDGDLDVVLGHSANRCSSGDHCYPAGERHARLFENKVGQDSNWLQVELVGGEGSNRGAIGAQVTVTYPDGSKQVREIGGGHGHYGIQHESAAHFGLGPACEVEVTVRWPDESLSTETHTLTSGYRWTWRQGELPEVVE